MLFVLERFLEAPSSHTQPASDATVVGAARLQNALAFRSPHAQLPFAGAIHGFARYLKLWRESREKVIRWFDPNVVAYGRDTGLAATWATSVIASLRRAVACSTNSRCWRRTRFPIR